MYVIDASGIALRCWLDYKKRRVQSVPCVVPRGNIIWAYCLVGDKQVLAHDLVEAVGLCDYKCFWVVPATAIKFLEVRYDVQNPWPVSYGECAGIAREREDSKAPVRRRRKDDGGGLFTATQ